MEESKDKLLPGTVDTHVSLGEKGFAKIAMLLEATGGLSLSQVCAVTGLEGSTIQNWVKRGWVARPLGKRYEEVHIARILIINALKECIKLEYIAQLMIYINGLPENESDHIIKESDLYNFLCSALTQLGQADDLSRSGVESVADKAISDYTGLTPYARVKIRKALSVMIYACVCTDVKRRTESMMQQILREIEDPESYIEELSGDANIELASDTVVHSDTVNVAVAQETQPAVVETRKTVAQALREWDLARVEDILNEDDDEGDQGNSQPESVANMNAGNSPTETAAEEKAAPKPWYFRRS